MATLTKETSAVQDIILAWAFENVDDWHDGLIDHITETRIDSCYEEARQLLVDNGHTSIPATKEDTISLASTSGYLLTMAQKGEIETDSPKVEELSESE